LLYWQRKETEASQRRIDRLFASTGVPVHFRDFTLDSLLSRVGHDPEKRTAIDAVRQFVDNGVVLDPITQRYKAGIVLSGKFGCGKTGLLTPALRAVVAQGKSGLWVEVYDFLGAVQQGYDDGDSNAKLSAAQSADVILLDDLGDVERSRPETDDRRRILYQLINYRHNNALPMLITTNCDGEKLANQLGMRTMERIFESCAWIEMGGRNLRME
jgi:DNA replication protein DnaC